LHEWEYSIFTLTLIVCVFLIAVRWHAFSDSWSKHFRWL